MKDDKLKYIETRTHSMDIENEDKLVHSLDLSGTIIAVSPGWLKMTGYKKEEVIGRHFVEFLDVKSLFTVQENFTSLKDFGFINHVPLRVVCKDKHIVSVELNGTSKYSEKGMFERTFCEITPLLVE